MFEDIASQAILAKRSPAGQPENKPQADRTRATRRATAHSGLEHFGELYGACEPMRALFRAIERLAASDAPVMILGESGAGKELVANTLHQLSTRAGQSFIAVNCGAIPENLIESELFGHERGSFTGASRTHRGCFERANGGTLFLDEITEMPVEMQVRLLRVLETGRFARVGGDQEINTDVRVLTASNRDLHHAVASGHLREDLMYRLCVIPLLVPPLRARGDDSLLLAEMFLAELNESHDQAKCLSDEARARILEYRWPGNVRELKNVIHRSFVLSDGLVEVDVDVSAQPDNSSDNPSRSVPVGPQRAPALDESLMVRIPVGMSLDDAERALIMATLGSVKGSKTKAAQVLGISLKTLYNRLHAYDEGLISNKGASRQEFAALAA